jgi:hypothetical protein
LDEREARVVMRRRRMDHDPRMDLVDDGLSSPGHGHDEKEGEMLA